MGGVTWSSFTSNDTSHADLTFNNGAVIKAGDRTNDIHLPDVNDIIPESFFANDPDHAALTFNNGAVVKAGDHTNDIHFGPAHAPAPEFTRGDETLLSWFSEGEVTTDNNGRWSDGKGNFFTTRTSFTPSEIQLIASLDVATGKLVIKDDDGQDVELCNDGVQGLEQNLACLDEDHYANIEEEAQYGVVDWGASDEDWWGESATDAGIYAHYKRLESGIYREGDHGELTGAAGTAMDVVDFLPIVGGLARNIQSNVMRAQGNNAGANAALSGAAVNTATDVVSAIPVLGWAAKGLSRSAVLSARAAYWTERAATKALARVGGGRVTRGMLRRLATHTEPLLTKSETTIAKEATIATERLASRATKHSVRNAAKHAAKKAERVEARVASTKAARVASTARRFGTAAAKDIALSEAVAIYAGEAPTGSTEVAQKPYHTSGRDTDGGNYGRDVTRDDTSPEYRKALFGGPAVQTDTSNTYLVGALIVAGGLLASSRV